MSLEKVENLMEETFDAVAYQNDISNLILTSSTAAMDDDEINLELEKLLTEEEVSFLLLVVMSYF